MKKLLIAFVGLLLSVSIANAKQLWEYASFSERADKAVELGLVNTPTDYTGY